MPCDSGGLLIWHYDAAMGNNTIKKGVTNPRDSTSHCRARVLEKTDGRNDIWFNKNKGEQTDLFYPGNPLNKGVFGPKTNPVAHSYYNVQAEDITVRVVSFKGGVTTFDVIIGQETKNVSRIVPVSDNELTLTRFGNTLQYHIPQFYTAISLQLFDLQGKIVKDFFGEWLEAGEHTIDHKFFSNLPHGCYIVRLEMAGFIRVLRLPIERS